MVDFYFTPRMLYRLQLLCTLLSKHMFINAEKSETNKKTGLIGAVPEEDLAYKKAIACQGQKLYIACSSTYDRIQVQASFYGREDSITCKHPDLPSDETCAEQNATVRNLVKDLCQGEIQCEVAVTNDFLAQYGTIICPNIYKYLYVRYRCVPKSALSDVPEASMPSEVYEVSRKGAPDSVRVDTNGETIISHKGGTQSVEEKITVETPKITQASETSKVTEIIQGQPAQKLSSVTTLQKPSPRKLSKVELQTLLQSRAKEMGITNSLSINSSKLENLIVRRRKRRFIPKPKKMETNYWQDNTETNK